MIEITPETPRVGGFLRLRQVLSYLPISKSAWWQGIKDGRYPQGIKIAPRTTAWRTSDIADLLERLSQGAQ